MQRASGIVRIELQGRPATADRSLQLAEVPERFGQREMECRNARPFHDRTLENLDGAVVLAALVVNVTDPVKRRGIRRLPRDNLRERRQGGIDFPCLVQLRRLGEEVFGRSHSLTLLLPFKPILRNHRSLPSRAAALDRITPCRASFGQRCKGTAVGKILHARRGGKIRRARQIGRVHGRRLTLV